MATVDDKIDAAVGDATTDISAAVAQDFMVLINVVTDVVQALAALQSMHPMAPAVLAPHITRALAGLDDMRAKLNA